MILNKTCYRTFWDAQENFLMESTVTCIKMNCRLRKLDFRFIRLVEIDYNDICRDILT